MVEEELSQHRADKADLDRATRIRNEYGRVNWLVSWRMVSDDKWLARVSSPHDEYTYEGIGRSREDAIHVATKKLMHDLNEGLKKAQESA